MSKDGPPSGRMGFGFQQAREAKVPFKASKTSAQMSLSAFVTKYAHIHPEIRRRVKDAKEEGKRAGSILDDLREEGLGEHYSLECYKEPDFQDYFSCDYLDSPEALKQQAEQGIRVGLFKSAKLWEYNVKIGGWVVIRTWP